MSVIDPRIEWKAVQAELSYLLLEQLTEPDVGRRRCSLRNNCQCVLRSKTVRVDDNELQ